MEEYTERIKSMYNDCWKIYKDYLQDYDMDRYNRLKDALADKYGHKTDITDLILWFAPRINRIHKMHQKGVR